MKYLFAAIDARQSQPAPAHHHHRSSRPKYNAHDLKKLLVEASEGVDDKTSSHDFVDTLERIVNEIKNTTEHSGPFLQKVKKTDVPDYYDVIKKPMDLATLQKRVKSQMYRNKKSFADDLDLIWSNCLLYNSHPSHPLRRSAEILRQKSNQLLEFITDPALPNRSLYIAAVQQQTGDRRRRGTATPVGGDDGDEDGDGDGESEEEDVVAGGSTRLALMGINRKLNGVNGDAHDHGTASPAGSRSQTPIHRRARGRLGRASRSPSELPPPELGFEDLPAILRTAQGMMDFYSLDAELSRLEEAALGPMPVPSTSNLGLLPHPPPPPPPASTTLALPTIDPPTSISSGAATPVPTPLAAPSAPSPRPASTPVPSPAKLTSLLKPLTAASINPPETGPTPEKPPDAVWWETLTSGDAVLAAGIPACGFADGPAPSPPRPPPRVKAVKEGVKVTPSKRKANGVNGTLVVNGKPNGKSKAKLAGDGRVARKVNGKTVAKKEKAKDKPNGIRKPGLAVRMKKNVETLREIKRLHHQLGNGAKSADGLDPSLLPLSDFESDDDADVGPSRIKTLSFQETGISLHALHSAAVAPKAARDSMAVVSERVLSHTGFDASASTAVGVLAHVAAEYIMNLGRTVRFYSDRYGSQLSSEQILLHALGENGVLGPSHLESYVTEDIDRYGAKLTDLRTKLKRARTQQLEGFRASPEADEQLFSGDGLAFGEVCRKLGEDFFGLAEMGLEREAGLAASLPTRLLRGDPKDTAAVSSLKFPPPPPHVPLTPSVVDCQIGLLRPFLLLRQKTEAGLVDDASQPVRPRSGRAKILATGRIPVKVPTRLKRKMDESASAPPVKLKKKNVVVERVESDG